MPSLMQRFCDACFDTNFYRQISDSYFLRAIYTFDFAVHFAYFVSLLYRLQNALNSDYKSWYIFKGQVLLSFIIKFFSE